MISVKITSLNLQSISMSGNKARQQLKTQQKLTDLTSQCVMCGLCLPHCPTYHISQDENESPRGRIALIQALAKGQLSYDEKVKSHLDNCLQCLSCQDVCPSQVCYSEIIHQGQQITFQQEQKKRLKLGSMGQIFIQQLLTRPFLKKSYIRLFNVLVKLNLLKHLKKLAKKLSIRSAYYLPDVVIAINPGRLASPHHRDGRKYVNIFTGCGNRLFDSQLSEQLRPLLEEMGLGIHEFNSDSCCGAIFQRNGDNKSLSQCIENNQQHYSNASNIASSNGNSALPLLSLTSTCTAQLKKDLQSNIYDICTFLASQEYARFKILKFYPLKQKVILHAACSLRNQLHEQEFPLKLLSHIPKIELLNFLPYGCCGAAGNYMLDHPTLADKIVQPYLQAIIKSDCHLLLSTNIGCALHIRAELEKLDYKLEVLHPVSLLSQQLNCNRNEYGT